MENCLDENELAEYADYLCYGAKIPDSLVLNHVVNCFKCKQDIMAISEIGELVNLMDLTEQ
ncbi:MAG: hypothetical protein V2A67_07280 [Bacteroidota bacterium]